MAASSSASAEAASSRSELSIQQAAQSTAGTGDEDDADDANQTSTATFKFGAEVPAATTSNTVATPTESNGSTITNFAASTSQPNTLSTSPSPSISSTATSEHDSDFPYRGPQNTGAAIQTSSKAFHAGGPSPGQVAAAVVIPLLFLIALVFAILFLRRRRRRSNVVPSELQQHHHHHPMADRSGAAFAKESAFQGPRRPSAIAPILTTTTNNTYYTGLSTPSTPSRTTSTNTRGPSDDSTRGAAVPSAYDIPPPAYAKLPPPGSTPTLPQLSFPADPFMDPDPVSPLTSPSTSTSPSTAHTNAALAALSGRDTSYTAVSLSPNSSRNGPTPARPDISRAGTMRSAASVTSDMYSDTASVHSAKPARMSGAPNLVVGGAGAGANWLDFESGDDGHRVSTGSEFAPGWVVGGHGGDPFRDPR
jgi:hypothetical protein